MIGVALVLLFAATPVALRFDRGPDGLFALTGAAAKDGGSSGSGSSSGSGGSGNSGSGSNSGSGGSGSSGSGSNSGSGGSGSSGGGGGHSGPGGGGASGGSGGRSNSGPGGGGEKASGSDGGGWHGHISRHGARIEINGDDIRVIYADGFREEISKGTLILKDPQGRPVVRRRATSADFARLRGL